jgi:hypothetical protein
MRLTHLGVHAHLGVQAAIVFTMVASVSYPQFRPAARTQFPWRYAPVAVLQARALDAARFAGDARTRPVAYVNAVASTTPALARNPLADTSFRTPPAVAVLGGKLNVLVGFARTSLNAPIPYARVVLRNIRTGRILSSTVANERGEFSFIDLDSTLYVVELVGADGSVAAASPLVTMAPGNVQQTELRVAASAATVTASFANTLTPTLEQATAVAASSDVTRTTTSQTTQESPR